MKVAIIGAMDKEIERYLELYNPELVDDEKKIYVKDNIVIAGSGIGKVNSAMMTQYLIDRHNVDIIISSGCAGSLTNDLKVLDVIIPTTLTFDLSLYF